MHFFLLNRSLIVFFNRSMENFPVGDRKAHFAQFGNIATQGKQKPIGRTLQIVCVII